MKAVRLSLIAAVAALAFLALCLAGGCTPRTRPTPAPPAPAPAPTPAPVPVFDTATALLAAHNAARAARGLPALSLNPLLTAAAQGHADFMAQRGILAHAGIGDGDPFSRMQAAGYAYGWAAENAAAGQVDTVQVMEAWLGDPPHRANVLGPHYRDVGFGLSRAANGTPYWCADFGSLR